MPSDTGPAALNFHASHNSASDADKGYITGWYAGDEVSLHYTKWYFCTEPPSSGADTGCEIGADAETAPRPGAIPAIYAIAAVGFQPDVSTLACPPGSVCLNHPAHLDASRVAGAGATNIPGVPHSHIVDDRQGGWHHTVNIRVFNLGVWNQIVAAKSLAKVRELQADPAVGGAGLISPDTPTNIFFFLQVQQEKPWLDE
jgi:hypothetical protein